VHDAAEDVATSDGAVVDCHYGMWDRRAERKATMWSRLLVMAERVGEHRFEVSSGDDEEMIG
jgi:hypothetical protein